MTTSGALLHLRGLLDEYHRLIMTATQAMCDWEEAYNIAYQSVNKEAETETEGAPKKLFLLHEERHVAAVAKTFPLYREWKLAGAEAQSMELRARCEAGLR